MIDRPRVLTPEEQIAIIKALRGSAMLVGTVVYYVTPENMAALEDDRDELRQEIKRLRALVEEQNSTLAIMRGTRASVIEECARVAESHPGVHTLSARVIARAIRARKEKKP